MKSSTPYLLTLPVEVQLKVLGDLDPKSIQRMRQVHGNFKTLVDQHAEHIVMPIQQAEIARLDAVIKRHDYKDLGLLEAFSRYVADKGAWRKWRTRAESIQVFAEHYLDTRSKPSPWEQLSWYQVVRLVCLCLDVNKDLSLVVAPGGFLKFKQLLALSDTPLDEDSAQTFYQGILGDPRLKNTQFHLDYRSGGDPPAWPLTALQYITHPYSGRCSDDQLHEALGLPRFFTDDTSDVRVGNLFTYCTESKWAMTEIFKHIENVGGDMDPVRKAALLQEISIY